MNLANKQTTSIVNFIVSFVYALLKFAFGLLIHPYQTMQDLVDQKLFVWLAILPMMILVFLTLFWNLIFVPLALVVFDSKAMVGAGAVQASLSFLATWITTFCFYWQMMLLYLLIRFRISFK
ncbi:MAG: hypothetical protein U9O78_04890 [Patescibacteria group bacterium]|nr:hypothetical protein [Patescibacteria group bacterium]